MGNVRMRLPVAVNTAFAIAGKISFFLSHSYRVLRQAAFSSRVGADRSRAAIAREHNTISVLARNTESNPTSLRRAKWK